MKRGRSLSAVSRPRRASSGSADFGLNPDFLSPDLFFLDPKRPFNNPLLFFSFFISFFLAPVAFGEVASSSNSSRLLSALLSEEAEAALRTRLWRDSVTAASATASSRAPPRDAAAVNSGSSSSSFPGCERVRCSPALRPSGSKLRSTAALKLSFFFLPRDTLERPRLGLIAPRQSAPLADSDSLF